MVPPAGDRAVCGGVWWVYSIVYTQYIWSVYKGVEGGGVGINRMVLRGGVCCWCCGEGGRPPGDTRGYGNAQNRVKMVHKTVKKGSKVTKNRSKSHLDLHQMA